MQINPVFENALPRQTEDEYKLLEESIVSAGKIYEPIELWGDVIVDGHHRWSIAQKHPEVKYTTRQLEFESEWHALEYIYKKQMGRRNLTSQQKSYALGKLYEARKQIRGNNADRGDNGKYLSRQNGASGGFARTDEIIAREQNTNPREVDRAYTYARAIDKADFDVPGFKDAVLSGKIKPTKVEVFSLDKMDDEERKTSAKKLMVGEKLPKAHKEYVQPTGEITFGSSYTAEDFRTAISTFPEELDSSIEHFLDMHKDMLGNKKCKADFIKMLNIIRNITDKYEEVANEH